MTSNLWCRRQHLVGLALFVGIAICSLSGCKRLSGSKSKSVDQFAGGQARYQCSGEYRDNEKYRGYFRGITSTQQSDAVQQALSAISPEIKDRIFLGPIAARVELTDRVGDVCKDSDIVKANRANLSGVQSCAVVKDGKAVVYVDQKPESIKSSLVRGLAYYFIHIDGYVDVNASNANRVVVGFTNLGDLAKNKRIQGALVFLDEAPRKEVFSTLLPPVVLNAKSKAERDAAFLDPAKNFVGDRDAFVNYFAAELLDSTLCSSASRAAFANEFPRTAEFFGARAAIKKSGNLSLAAQRVEGPTGVDDLIGTEVPQDQVVGSFSNGLLNRFLWQNVAWAGDKISQAGDWIGNTGRSFGGESRSDSRDVSDDVRRFFGQGGSGSSQNPSGGMPINPQPLNPRPLGNQAQAFPDWRKNAGEEPTGTEDSLRKIPVEPRVPADGLPSGFKRSDQRIEFWTPEAKENTGESAELYIAADGKSQVWQGPDGRWRQAPTGSGERSVKILDRSPLEPQVSAGGRSNGGGVSGQW